jgi:hypothetical protein
MLKPQRPVAPELSKVELGGRIAVRVGAASMLTIAVIVGWVIVLRAADIEGRSATKWAALAAIVTAMVVIAAWAVALSAAASLGAAAQLGVFVDARAYVVETVVPTGELTQIVRGTETRRAYFVALFDIDDAVRSVPLCAVPVGVVDAARIADGRVVSVYGTPSVGHRVVVAWDGNIIDQVEAVVLPGGARPYSAD